MESIVPLPENAEHKVDFSVSLNCHEGIII